jgi:protein ImuB
MYACLHTTAPGRGEDLRQLALEFSPAFEQTSPDTAVFSINPLRKLIGSPHQIASEICRLGYERKLQASLAIAANPDTAVLLARNCIGVTLVTPGEERLKLAPLPLTCLFGHDIPVDPALAQVLHRWGLKTCEDLAALPENGLAERLGKAGVYLRNLSCGRIHRPLRLPAPETSYRERLELEHPVSLLEPLLFLLARVLNELCGRLRTQSKAARILETRLELEGHKDYQCELEFPVPIDDSQSILKLLQLHLERHSPVAPIVAFTLRIEPTDPRRVQGGFFVPPTPPPDKLQITLERIAGMVGKENAGTPVLLNTHRPDAFRMGALNTSPNGEASEPEDESADRETVRLVMRLFRPALNARVTLADCAPKYVYAPGVKGNVVELAGPWKTSGEWWAPTAWTREEWDVALDDGALYRIYEQPQTHDWYVHGVYD